MNVSKIVVILTDHGMDLVVLHSDLPSPVPGVTNEPLEVTFFAQYDTGLQYVKTHFPNVPVNVIPRSKI